MPLDCLMLSAVCAAGANQTRSHKHYQHLALMYVDVVLMMRASQKCTNEESVDSDNGYMYEATSNWCAVHLDNLPVVECCGFYSLNFSPNSFTKVTTLITC